MTLRSSVLTAALALGSGLAFALPAAAQSSDPGYNAPSSQSPASTFGAGADTAAKPPTPPKKTKAPRASRSSGGTAASGASGPDSTTKSGMSAPGGPGSPPPVLPTTPPGSGGATPGP